MRPGMTGRRGAGLGGCRRPVRAGPTGVTPQPGRPCTNRSSRLQDLETAASKHVQRMSDIYVLTESGVTSLSSDALLWLIERATLEFPDGTLDRLDQGLADGVVALNASDLAAISEFFYGQLDAADPATTRAAPEVSELTAALTAWADSDGR